MSNPFDAFDPPLFDGCEPADASAATYVAGYPD